MVCESDRKEESLINNNSNNWKLRQQVKAGLVIGYKMQMIGIYQDQGFGEFHFQYGLLKMAVNKIIDP